MCRVEAGFLPRFQADLKVGLYVRHTLRLQAPTT